MKVFLSYASEQRSLAERTCRVLESEGHDVFFDRDDLQAGDAYGERIRTAMLRSGVCVFFVSRHSIVAPSYALTELVVVQGIPARRRPRMLPVLTEPLDLETLPAFLKPLTLLEPQGDLSAEVAAKVSEIGRRRRGRWFATLTALSLVAAAVTGAAVRRSSQTTTAVAADPLESLSESVRNRTPEAGRVTFTGSLSNSGWTVNLNVADLTAREILYRLDDDTAFHSLGVRSTNSLLTGQPQPVSHFDLPGPAGEAHHFEVKYIDGKAKVWGPYRFRFEPKAEYVRNVKDLLTHSVTDWVSFREDTPGRLLMYVRPLWEKNAFREIRYSVDSDALTRTLTYTQDWSQRGPPDNEGDEGPVRIPLETRYVAVKLYYIDGTESELKRFVLSDVGIGRSR